VKAIQRNEILPLGDYEGIRPHFRARVIEEKKARRFALGQHLSGVFENRDTVLLQIQEMLRTERITREDGIAHEIETYNELLPGKDEVSMTCFVEIADRALREEMLEKLAGLERCFAVEVDGEAFAARNTRDEDAAPHRTTAVHYLKAKLSPEAMNRVLTRAAKVAVLVRHPAYEARAQLGRAALDALASDLAPAREAPAPAS
jgi:hypothetical protein